MNGSVSASGRASRGEMLILANQDWFFLSHFLQRAQAAQRAGFDVTVICADSGRAAEITAYGLRYQPVTMSRHGLNPLAELRTVRQLHSIYRERQPQLLWQIGLKPIVLGTLSAILAGRSGGIVNAPVGMGFVFAANSVKAKLLRPAVNLAMRLLLNPARSKVIFENMDDLRELVAQKMVCQSDAILIRGAGVELDRYKVHPAPDGIPVVLFAARLIWEKGVGLFADAARLLRQRGVQARFVIAGGIDRDNSSAVPEAQLRAWVDEGIVEWIGPRNDMPDVLSACSIFCLPTWYREGLPKVLLEAMASGRAIVTTDAVGCREAVSHGVNGLLVPPKDSRSLADSLQRLLNDSTLRAQFGAQGRIIAEQAFGADAVCARTMEVFNAAACSGR